MFGRTKKKPLISYQINALKGAGVSEIAIVTGYKSEMLENFSDIYFITASGIKLIWFFHYFALRVGLIKV